MSKSPISRAGAATTALVLALSLGVTACSSDDDTSTADGTTTTAPEQKISTDADVAAGLAKMQASVDKIVAAGTDTAAATKADEELEPVWSTIEGTIKKNEPSIYTDIEDSLSLLSDGAAGDAEKTTTGAADMTKAITDYLAKHPA
ncbi:MAG: hypothetical protein U0Q22_13320 [Acidimicrobiales bacterium]